MKYPIIVLFILFVLTGCSKKADSGGGTVAPAPGKANLLFPSQNAACTSGTILSPTQTTVTFNWTSDSNSDSYDFYIKNLITSTISSQTFTTNQAQVNLLPNTPYSWYILSKSSKTTLTTQSDTWKFYLSGPGVISHPPYPADVLKPTFGQNIAAVAGTINLNWTGSDPDNDIAGYDIYLGTTATPPLLKSNVSDMFVNAVSVISGRSYYWRVITKDGAGNSSDSGIFQFKVN